MSGPRRRGQRHPDELVKYVNVETSAPSPESLDATRAELPPQKFVRDPRASARAQVLAVSSSGGPGELCDDDVVEVTIGRQKFKDYDIGPIAIRGRLKQGESLLEAYTRLRAAAAALFELEAAERLMDHAVLSGPETFAKHIESER